MIRIILEYGSQSVKIESDIEAERFFEEKLVLALRAIDGNNLADRLEDNHDAESVKKKF